MQSTQPNMMQRYSPPYVMGIVGQHYSMNVPQHIMTGQPMSSQPMSQDEDQGIQICWPCVLHKFQELPIADIVEEVWQHENQYHHSSNMQYCAASRMHTDENFRAMVDVVIGEYKRHEARQHKEATDGLLSLLSFTPPRERKMPPHVAKPSPVTFIAQSDQRHQRPFTPPNHQQLPATAFTPPMSRSSMYMSCTDSDSDASIDTVPYKQQQPRRRKKTGKIGTCWACVMKWKEENGIHDRLLTKKVIENQEKFQHSSLLVHSASCKNHQILKNNPQLAKKANALKDRVNKALSRLRSPADKDQHAPSPLRTCSTKRPINDIEMATQHKQKKTKSDLKEMGTNSSEADEFSEDDDEYVIAE